MKTKLPAILRPLALALAALACLRSPLPAATQGGDLFFRTTSTPITSATIEGQITAADTTDASFVISGAELPTLMDGSSATTLVPGNVRVWSKRDTQNLYLGFDIDDGTNPPAGGPPERVELFLDPDHSGGTAPAAGDFRLIFKTARGSAASDLVEWYQGDGSTWVTGTLPASIVVRRQNRSSGIPGYAVEFLIPLSAIGYTSPAPVDPPDIGLAFTVVNSLGFTGTSSWAVTRASFPSISGLASTSTSASTVSGAWNSPDNWGVGNLSGAGSSVFLTHTPEFWRSDDIKATYTRVTTFPALDNAYTPSADWYHYPIHAAGSPDPIITPCPIRVWNRINRRGLSQGEVKRRVLVMWADHGANPQNWRSVGLSSVVDLNALPVPVPAVPASQTLRAVGTPVDWQPPAGLENHPCIQAYLLPDKLDPADVTAVAPGAVLTPTQLQALSTKYGLSGAHVAQMNLDQVQTGTGACQVSSPVPTLVQTLSSDLVTRPESSNTGGRNMELIVVEFEAFGIETVLDENKKEVSVISSLGGVVKSYALKDVAIRDGYIVKLARPVTFNVSNSSDVRRRLFVVGRVHGPASLKPMTVLVDNKALNPKGDMPWVKPGATLKVTNATFVPLEKTDTGPKVVEGNDPPKPGGKSGCATVGLLKSFSLLGALFALGLFAYRFPR